MIDDLSHKELTRKFRELVKESLAQKQLIEELQSTCTRQEELVEDRTSDLLDLDGALHEEIAELRRADNVIQRQNRFLINIIESITHPFYVVNAENHKIILANSATADRHEWLGSTCYALTHKRATPCGGGDHICPLEKVKQNGKFAVVEHTHFDRAGNELCYEVHGHPIFDDQGRVRHMVEYCIDISDRKRLEKELLKTRTLEATAILAGGIAHDFNNLLTAITGYIDLSKNRLPPDDPARNFLSNAAEAASQAAALATKFITFSKGGHPRKKTASITAIIAEAAACSIKKPKISYTLSSPDELWPVEVDPVQMHHAFAGIIANAVEAMPEGGLITINCENINHQSPAKVPACCQRAETQKSVRIAIRDQGTGISEENLSNIFDPYFSTKKLGCIKGMGLGLSTAYSIIKKHGGQIHIDSDVGIGTTVNICLPVA